jgi:hypothetical protein
VPRSAGNQGTTDDAVAGGGQAAPPVAGTAVAAQRVDDAGVDRGAGELAHYPTTRATVRGVGPTVGTP